MLRLQRAADRIQLIADLRAEKDECEDCEECNECEDECVFGQPLPVIASTNRPLEHVERGVECHLFHLLPEPAAGSRGGLQ